ncbi:hypothetical protein LCGC14_2310650 [marine sediment metagenome]|uniref:Uncharacterized protein n=1 Tax=marine sediment metagenome TaxID=412755 RepID=A0A0F9D889_9ZZZZ
MDYKVLNACDYECHDYYGELYSCGEPAPYQVWWEDGKPMTVCKTHFDFMIDAEAKVAAPMTNTGEKV